VNRLQKIGGMVAKDFFADGLFLRILAVANLYNY